MQTGRLWKTEIGVSLHDPRLSYLREAVIEHDSPLVPTLTEQVETLFYRSLVTPDSWTGNGGS